MNTPEKKSEQPRSQRDLINKLVKDEDVEKKIINIDPITVVVIITMILLVPLLITGFISH
ncbi:MAG: hypothetical protein QNJ46_20155 [Leptolyngbyaceae cyanobacterium MO_188.B28]|nr:hypothetical protein [Leptolyngbyaceae cyanobacterium MO_188.B28]